MIIQIGGRSINQILGGLSQKRHYHALWKSFTIYQHPLDGLLRYLFSSGEYPIHFSLKTPIGTISPCLYTPHDMLTVNEIFCREDYNVTNNINIVVDFGSNIGISALYFLTRSDNVNCYLFEPLPENLKKLKKNIAPYENRCHLTEVAVGLNDEDVEFGYEDTGRYGGIGKPGQTLTVPCRNAAAILRDLVNKHGEIDVLKVDIETLEKEIVASIPFEIANQIKLILVEQQYAMSPLPTHRFIQYGSIARFERMDPPDS